MGVSKGLKETRWTLLGVTTHPSFLETLIYMISGPSSYRDLRNARDINKRDKNEDLQLTCADREDEVSKIFIISLLCSTGSGTIFVHAERL